MTKPERILLYSGVSLLVIGVGLFTLRGAIVLAGASLVTLALLLGDQL